LIAGKIVVVSGYGWCGRGFAMRARGMGANVVITEVDYVKALEAIMDGFSVLPMKTAAKKGDLFVTLTGDISVLRAEHFKAMKDGAIIANSGHFNVEIDIPALKKMSRSKRIIRSGVEEYTLKNGKRINLLGEGRLVNLACAEGHPAIVMDMSFANQALGAEYLVKKHSRLKSKVYKIPEDIDRNIASLKLKSMGIGIDKLTPFQQEYLSSWEIGT
jgi:adenosylhomocysteinase